MTCFCFLGSVPSALESCPDAGLPAGTVQLAPRSRQGNVHTSLSSSNPRPSRSMLIVISLAQGALEQHVATGGVMPASHLPVLLDGRVLGGDGAIAKSAIRPTISNRSRLCWLRLAR